MPRYGPPTITKSPKPKRQTINNPPLKSYSASPRSLKESYHNVKSFLSCCHSNPREYSQKYKQDAHFYWVNMYYYEHPHTYHHIIDLITFSCIRDFMLYYNGKFYFYHASRISFFNILLDC